MCIPLNIFNKYVRFSVFVYIAIKVDASETIDRFIESGHVEKHSPRIARGSDTSSTSRGR